MITETSKFFRIVFGTVYSFFNSILSRNFVSFWARKGFSLRVPRRDEVCCFIIEPVRQSYLVRDGEVGIAITGTGKCTKPKGQPRSLVSSQGNGIMVVSRLDLCIKGSRFYHIILVSLNLQPPPCPHINTHFPHSWTKASLLSCLCICPLFYYFWWQNPNNIASLQKSMVYGHLID